MVTMREIAEAAKVSVYTVSCALRGQAQVAKSTRERIEKLARDMGYERDASAVLLAAKRRPESRKPNRRMRLAVTTGSHHREWTDPFREEARRLGYDTELVDPRAFNSGEVASRVLWSRGVHGIFLRPAQAWMQEDWWQGFECHRFAVVKWGRILPWLRCRVVRHSAFDYAMETLRHVYSKGLASVAAVLTQSHSEWDDDARLGAVLAYRSQHLKAGQSLEVFLTEEVPGAHSRSRMEMYKPLSKWLESIRPQVVVGFPWTWCYVLDAFGWSIPDKVQFAAIIAPEPGQGVPPIAGCERRTSETSHLAVRMLHESLLAGGRGILTYPREDVVEPIWREGATLP